MRVCGSIIKNKVKENFFGQTAKYMKDTSKMISVMVLAHFFTLTAKNMKDIGRKETKTAKDHSSTQMVLK